MQIFNFLYVVAGVVLLFGAAIFVHEFGHYWMARRRGLKVEAFAIGFGPKIFGWTKDGIEYSWRWIPAGGYVKLPQMVTSEALEGTAEGAEKIPPAEPFSKILVALAGPVMNVVLAFAIAGFLYVVGVPVKVNPSVVGFVEPGSEEAKLGILAGDRIVSVNGKKVKSWEDVHTITFLAPANVLPVVLERDGQRKEYQLAAKINNQIGLKMLGLEPRDHPILKRILEGGPGEAAGMKAEDEVISFGGVAIHGREQFINLIKQRGGQKTVMIVKRAGEKVELTVTPLLDPVAKIGRISVEVGSNAKDMYEIQHPLPWVMVADVWDQMVGTLGALINSKQTGVGAKDLSGPVGILAVLGAQVNTDYRLALKFLVLLNINLAVLNMLPIPVLDGGHIVMAILEKIRRRPLSMRLQEYMTTAFALMLISFMLYVTFFDIKRMPLFWHMFKQEKSIEQQQPSPAPEAPANAPAPATSSAPAITPAPAAAPAPAPATAPAPTPAPVKP